MDDASRLSEALAPLDAALMSAARARCEVLRDDAAQRAGKARADGESRAKALLAQAAADGARVAAREAAHRLVEAKRAGRAVVLGAQRMAWERLLAESAAAAVALTTHPEYAALEQRLADAAARALGSAAEVVRNPDGRGGVLARCGRRSIELTLPAIARRCVERLGVEVTGLWT
jgi:hypothetical protein